MFAIYVKGLKLDLYYSGLDDETGEPCFSGEHEAVRFVSYERALFLKNVFFDDDERESTLEVTIVTL